MDKARQRENKRDIQNKANQFIIIINMNCCSKLTLVSAVVPLRHKSIFDSL